MRSYKIHPLQEKILKLAQEKELSNMSLREIGALVGDRSPQKIKHHLQQLQKKGLIKMDKINGVTALSKGSYIKDFLDNGKRLLRIPIVGSANCGPAEIVAEENILGYLMVSNSIIHNQTGEALFAVRADGFSMNQAVVNNKTIENGDYLVIDNSDPTPREGEVILSVIDGLANVKRYHEDKENEQIVLLSDSSEDLSPIYISQEDSFVVNGKVVNVIKNPK